ncbi:MAG: MurT ligase domain-containing protein [Candidatus Faecousia sp.]|uniref:MurT ligase domain-containing protein n=1 Tax=Faecousia sp. TaxID=2952921 RepID=UPI002A8ECD25|nr:MurT ligase domain-containing protein [Candidatus Faecousia sp.]
MKLLLAILVCRALTLIGRLVGKGTSLPGKYALKVCPDILSRIRKPEMIVAVTGSNGKTSTVEMIASVLKASGKTVAYNSEGSNQIEGVTTMILNSCTLGGKMKQDVLLIESDERYTKYTFRWFHPTHYVITNLYRDQLTRNGHPEWVYDAIAESIFDDTTLILNADDPMVSQFGYHRNGKVLWFGLDRCKEDTEQFVGMYNDMRYCPVCGQPMEYDYYHYNQVGCYRCTACDFRRHDTDFTVTDVDLAENRITVNGTDEIRLALSSIYNVYNILAAYAVCSLLGVPGKEIARLTSNYILKNGRYIEFRLGSHDGVFLISKHENSVSYDMSFRYAVSQGKPFSAVIIVDAVSRKYFTSETSWLWDINFGLLQTDLLKRVYLCGKYCNDLAMRLSFTDIPQEKIKVFEDIDAACEEMCSTGSEPLYAVTCFSDREKFLSNTERR